jgi:hypothetical protein
MQGASRPGSVPRHDCSWTRSVDIQLSGAKPCISLVARFSQSVRDVHLPPPVTKKDLVSSLRNPVRFCSRAVPLRSPTLIGGK